jgi:hypothetical protein
MTYNSKLYARNGPLTDEARYLAIKKLVARHLTLLALGADSAFQTGKHWQ